MKIQVYKETLDDWYPNYFNKCVRVSFTQTGPDPKNNIGEYRVCVWGDDDYGMERDFGNKEHEAFNIFLQVIGMKTVEKCALIDLGFVSA